MMKGYKWDAKLYKQYSSFQVEIGLEIIKRLDPQNYERILDVGCGPGIITIELAKLVPNGEVIGIDLSEEMIENAKLNIKNSELKNIEVINMDALALIFKDKFDAIFSNWVIHWIKDIQLLFNLFYKCLKKNSRFIALIFKTTGISNKLGYEMLRLMRKPELKPYYKGIKLPLYNRTDEVYYKTLNNSGFSDVKIEPYTYTINFSSRNELINHHKASGLVPFLDPLPKEQKIIYMKYYENIINQIQPDSNQTVFNTVILSGKKK